MKLKSLLTVILIGIFIDGFSNPDLDILKKTNAKLHAITTVQYQTEYKNFLGDPSGKRYLGRNDSATIFFDFRSKDTILGAKYLYIWDQGNFGFNGFTSFFTVKEKKQLVYNDVKSYDDLNQIGFRAFNILSLRKLLPLLLNDTAVSISRLADTIINNTDCYQFSFKMIGKCINRENRLVTSNNFNRSYSLMIDKKNNLPKQFIDYFERKSPVWIVSYDHFDFTVTKDNAELDYAKRDSDYVKFTQEEFLLAQKNENILKNSNYLGRKAEEWTLPAMAGDSVSLSKINADLVMLEFWFPNCTGCIAAIPDINEIQKSYQQKGLRVYGIEFTKNDSIGLAHYIDKMGIHYPTLFSGKKIAKDYKVSAGPSVFLINKAGKIVYAKTGFIKEEVIQAIEKNLN